MKKFALVLVALLVAACNSTTPKNPPQLANDRGTKDQHKETPADPSQTGGGTQTPTAQTQSVYFEFAKAAVTPEYNGVITQDAQAIKTADNGTVTLEGNCDERGSAEYNLGLGQRRADAVKKLLIVAGVPAKHVKATSLGEDKPKATCHDESCWKENRRVDVVQGS